MIIGYLSNLKAEIALYPLVLQTGLKFLLETDFSALPLGRYEIEGSKIYATISEYETQPKENRRPEAHKKYIDIQYIYAGAEMLGAGPLPEVNEIAEDCLAEKDVVFYKGIATETEVVLSQGMFAVYFPWDVHRPNCNAGGKVCKVRKVVIKIAVEALGANNINLSHYIYNLK